MPFFTKKGKLSKKDQSLARLETFKKEISTDCHILPLDELFVRLNTDPVSGLTTQQAHLIFEKTGPNALTPSKKKPEIIKFLATLFHGFSMLLWLGCILCYASVGIKYLSSDEVDQDNIILGGVLAVVVIVTGAFMYYQERKSQGIMDSFANMVPAKAVVIRGGVTMEIVSRNIVLGDLVELKFGDRVPADVRIIHSQGLKVDNSPITGESEAQARGTTCTDENFLETKNVAFFSTNIIEGIGRGVAIGCGDHTVMGHIAGLTARLQPNKTPMARELDRFMKIISIWACALGFGLGITSLCLGRSILDTVLFTIGIIVANVPEGLLATVLVCLTVTAQKMAVKNCLIKNLEAVETLGSTSVICSDKTGTLTQNKMTVCHMWYNNKVSESDLSQSQEKAAAYNTADQFKTLLRCAALCNRAEFLSGEESKPILQRKVRGDASEEAILKFVEISGILGENYRQNNPKLVEIPFSSATKFQLSVHVLPDGSCLVVMKGAPEVVLERCNKIYFNNTTTEMTPNLLEICNKACMRFAEMGERVLGFCDLTLDERFTKTFRFTTEPANFPLRGLRFLGLLAMIDPARPQVPDAIRKCKAAGIRVAMVTGDHPVTAKAIAIKVGIITDTRVVELIKLKDLRRASSPHSDGSLVIHGSVLRYLLQEELDDLLYNNSEIVFARTSPTQKLQIVEGYQRLGEIVAVTGDGVNDAPALKKADIGIAMGITGTEVSQQAADIILMDDNFASIVLGIEEGRKIFDNLKKSITYTLASNVPEILPFLAYSFMDIPLPMGVIAILCIDLLTDMMPAISLAYEKAESDIMSRPPRNPIRDKLVTRKLYFLAYGHLGMMEALAAFYVYFILMAEHGFYPSIVLGIRSTWENETATTNDSYGQSWTFEERKTLEYTCYTAFMVTTVIMQWANLVACKTRINSILEQGMGNMVLNASLVIETILALMLTYVPKMYYLKFCPVSFRVWLYPLPLAALLLLFDEGRKWHIRKYPRGWYQRETSY